MGATANCAFTNRTLRNKFEINSLIQRDGSHGYVVRPLVAAWSYVVRLTAKRK